MNRNSRPEGTLDGRNSTKMVVMPMSNDNALQFLCPSLGHGVAESIDIPRLLTISSVNEDSRLACSDEICVGPSERKV